MTGIRSWTLDGHGIRGRGQDRAGLDPVAIGVFPTIPHSREREQLPLDLPQNNMAAWLCPSSLPLVKSVRRDQAPCDAFSGSRNAGFVAAVSDLALIMLAAPEVSFAQCGMRPHRISESSRTRFLRILADHRDRLRGRDVVARRPFIVPRATVEIFLDKLLPPRQVGSVRTWREIMADWMDGRANLATAASLPAHGFPTLPNDERQND